MLQGKINFTHVTTDRTGQIRIRNTTPVLTKADRIGNVLVRWDIGRNNYRVDPGLYACGKPDRSSIVLVSANYKLTFDMLRKELAGLDAWILVLDTHGVNVWCAAGKGTFGTDELLNRIRITKLALVVDHRELILPQLGASGVAGYRITAESGFSVRFGPVYARDLPEYLANGKEKNERMGKVSFTLRERMAVAPVEIAHAIKFVPVVLLLAFCFSLPAGGPFLARMYFNLLSMLGGAFAGTVLFPALLPILPFKAFSAKGAVLGFVWCAFSLAVTGASDGLAVLAATLVTVPLVSFLSMNFTGASTFTCQKGAELEVKLSLPPMIALAAGGIAVGIVHFFLAH